MLNSAARTICEDVRYFLQLGFDKRKNESCQRFVTSPGAVLAMGRTRTHSKYLQEVAHSLEGIEWTARQ